MAASEAYDFVVVGAGSAGCVLAGRLSEDPLARVLVLEAGPPDDVDEVRIPAAFYRLFKTERDWDFTTEEQKQLHGRRLYWPRGRMLGGCSSLNAMIYVRGSRLDYDGWRDAYGATGWGFADLLPYFRRAEDNARFGSASGQRGASPWHGSGGPLRVEDLRQVHELTDAFVARGGRCRHPADGRLQRRAARTAPAATRSPSAAAGAGRPRTRTCGRRCAGGTSPSSPTPSSPG